MGRWAFITLSILLAILFQKSYSEEFLWERLSIDCGTAAERNIWQTDDKFIKSGLNTNVSTNITPQEMNTLRYFPDAQKNCYNLPLKAHYKYLIRAGFYYGNYDGISKAQIFSLHINGQYWTDIFTADPTYVEIIYPNYKNNFELCLIHFYKKKDEVPYISSLEATLLPNDLYTLMDNNTILRLQSRFHFGGDRDIGRPLEYVDDSYNRIWKLKQWSDYQNVTSNTTIRQGPSPTTQNMPPYAVLADAIAPQNNSDSIFIWVGPGYPTLAYFVLYFNEPTDQLNSTINRTRKFHIYINGVEMGMADVPQNGTSQVVSLYPVRVDDWTNVTLAPAEGSTFPPIINAMEVFTTFNLTSSANSCYCSSMVLAVVQVFGTLIFFWLT